jgi:hypothetical protein
LRAFTHLLDEGAGTKPGIAHRERRRDVARVIQSDFDGQDAGRYSTLQGAGAVAMDSIDEKPLCGYDQLAEFLTDNGFRISRSWISKVCSPSINCGPQIEGYWGKLPMVLPSRAIAWARARVRPVSIAQLTPAAPNDADRGPSASLPAQGSSPTSAQSRPRTGPANGTADLGTLAPIAAAPVAKPLAKPRRGPPKPVAAPAATAQPERLADAKPRPRNGPRQRATAPGIRSTSTVGERAP